MSDSYIQIAPDSTGKKVDNSLLTVNGVDVYRQRVEVSGSLGVGGLTTDAWGAQKVSIPRSIYHGMFTFDIPAKMWFLYEDGVQVYTSTNITSTSGAAKITADATNPTCLLESRECPRYQPNRGHLFSTALWCPLKTNDGVREWGLSTAENGVFFRLKANGLLYAVLKSGGVETKEELISTADVASFDVQKGNVYDIQYHTFSNLGTLTALSTENPALPIMFKSVRTTADVSLYVGCADITSENGMPDVEQYASAYASAVSVTTNTPVISIYNPLQINGVTNTRTITLARISFNCSKKGVFKVWMTRSAAAITGETLKVIGDGSFVQCDSVEMDATAVKATAITTANCSLITAVPVEPAVPRLVDNPYQGRIDFPIVRGDYLIVTCTSATATADVVIEWGEQV